MKRALVWSGVIVAAAALDLGARFALDIEFEDVLWIEALIFVATALLLYRLYRKDPAPRGWRRGFQVALVACFALGALRSALWASGQPVTLANAVILVLGVVGWFFGRHLSREAEAAAPGSDDASSVSAEGTARET